MISQVFFDHNLDHKNKPQNHKVLKQTIMLFKKKIPAPKFRPWTVIMISAQHLSSVSSKFDLKILSIKNNNIALLSARPFFP